MLRHRLGSVLTGAVLAGAAVAASTPAASAAAAAPAVRPGPALVRPFTGTGCHTYNFWSGAQVCITVYGAGLLVTAVSGETDGPDSDWGEFWDSAGVVDVWGHPSNHRLTVDWSSGGGIWLPQDDDFCFTDATLNQTACVLVHS